MQRELLRGEQRRVLVLGALLIFLLGLLILLRAVPEMIDVQLRSRLLGGFIPALTVVLGYLVYEAGAWFWLAHLQRGNLDMPAGYRYLNAFLEVSLPTAVLVVTSPYVGGLASVVGPLPFVYFLFILLTALDLDFRLSVFAGAVAGTEFLIGSLLLVDGNTGALASGNAIETMLSSPHQTVVKAALLLAGGFIAGYVASQIRRELSQALAALDERDRAISIFGQHVSPEVAALLLKQPMDFAGEERIVCGMFLDIRDFSRFADERTPTETVTYLNTLFGFMIPIVNDHRGIVNKFLGDGFMAVFGTPLERDDSCRHAVESARKILDRVEKLSRDGLIPETRLGIGLHLGPAITGNVGGRERKEYTVIGDVVNLASRIEQATKVFHARLLVSDAVAQSLGGGAAVGEDLGLVELRGHANAIRLFKLA